MGVLALYVAHLNMHEGAEPLEVSLWEPRNSWAALPGLGYGSQGCSPDLVTGPQTVGAGGIIWPLSGGSCQRG